MIMNRLPKIFSIGKRPAEFAQESRSFPTLSRTKGRYRHNAFKNADSSKNSSASYFSRSEHESPRLDHLDLGNGSRSFRVDGSEDVLEVICKSLGCSEISDFSLALEEYEELKSRSSPLHDAFDKVQFTNLNQLEDDVIDTMECPSDGDCILKTVDVTDVIYRDRIRDNVVGPIHSVNHRSGDDVITSGKSKAFLGNHIKGARPQELARPPLSAIIMADEEFATWDLCRHALNSDTYVSRLQTGLNVEENEPRIQDGFDDDMSRLVVVNGENPLLSGSCSFTTTSADDDTSSTTTERMSNISRSGKCRVVIGDWQKGDLIGNGSVGSVYEGFSDCGLIFAVKQVSLLDQGEEGKQRIIQLQQEIALLSQFEHKNIVRYYGTRKDDSNLYIFLELVPKGSLMSLYKKYDLRVTQVSNYTRQILRGMKYLHDRNIIHRDIKCANILVETNRSVKLADFGLAKVIKMSDVISCKGTPFWMAPEVVQAQRYGLAADIWSLGCTVLEMLTRNFPYSNMERMAALFKIGSGERPLVPNSITGDARDMILQCLQVDPSMRPTATQLLNHPFVKRTETASPANL